MEAKFYYGRYFTFRQTAVMIAIGTIVSFLLISMCTYFAIGRNFFNILIISGYLLLSLFAMSSAHFVDYRIHKNRVCYFKEDYLLFTRKTKTIKTIPIRYISYLEVRKASLISNLCQVYIYFGKTFQGRYKSMMLSLKDAEELIATLQARKASKQWTDSPSPVSFHQMPLLLLQILLLVALLIFRPSAEAETPRILIWSAVLLLVSISVVSFLFYLMILSWKKNRLSSEN